MQRFTAAIIALYLVVCGGAAAADKDVVLIKARVLFRDPQSQQPLYECPKSINPDIETICMRYPHAYTIDVRDVLIGNGLPRRMHAILWIHTNPPDMDLAIFGQRKPSGEVEASEWGVFKYLGCSQEDEVAKQLGVQTEVVALQHAGRLPCVKD